MIDDEVRELFQTAIPLALAQGPALGEGFRCRFHVGDVGAWEIDLRRRPRCVEARLATGGYHAVVYVSAEDFGSLVQSKGATLDELVTSGRLRTTGDAARALEMTKVVVRGAPFVWTSSLRVIPVSAALFGATEEDLLQAFPGWSRALPVDPEHEDSTFAPLAPPFPFVLAPLSREWWDYLLDSYVMLVPGDREARDVRDDDSLELWEMTDRVFPRVFAGRDAESNVYAAPQRLATALASLADEDCDVLAAKLATQVYPSSSRPNPFTGFEQDYSAYRDSLQEDARRDLRAGRELSRSLSPSERLWFWGWFE